MPDLATNDTIDTVINVDKNSSDGPQLPPLDVKKCNKLQCGGKRLLRAEAGHIQYL